MQHPNNQNVCLCNNEVVGIFIKHCWADDMTRKGLDKKSHICTLVVYWT